MDKPLILSVDDDTNVLNVIERDLRGRYGADYQIVAINSGHAALEHLRKVQEKNQTTALFLVDQRMPQMTGLELLKQARMLYPAARRVLLTAYADTEAAMEAINTVQLDYYLMKPWEPPEERLYPILDDLLGDWKASLMPPGAR